MPEMTGRVENALSSLALPCDGESSSTEKSAFSLGNADSPSSAKLCHSQEALRVSPSSLTGSKGHFHGVQKGTGIGKHLHGKGIDRACKLAHLEVAAEYLGHALLTSPRLLRSPGRKKSPIRWFPRKKTESYLDRKIRMLQAKEGNVASLDETLGAANPHLSRIEREKLAAQAAAAEAIDARKGALIEASWCRILKLAEIPCKSAISELQKAEKKAAAALAEAEIHGVILQHGTAEREYAAEAVTASLETAFDVDKEVTAAIKAALQQLCRSSERAGEMQDETNVEFTSLDDMARCSTLEAAKSLSDTGSKDCKCEEQMTPTGMDNPRKNLCSKPGSKNEGKSKAEHSLVDLMASRIRELSVEHQTALAGIVATRGLSELLKDQSLEQELNGRTSGLFDTKPLDERSSDLGSILVKHVSRLQREVQASKETNRHLQTDVEKRSSGRLQRPVAHVESLDQILVKHVSKLEKEKLAAQAARRSPSKQKCNSVAVEEIIGLAELLKKPHDQKETYKEVKEESQTFSTADLGSILKKHVSTLEKEKQAALRMRESMDAQDADLERIKSESAAANSFRTPEATKKSSHVGITCGGKLLNPPNEMESLNAGSKKTHSTDSNEIPDLGSILVKHVSKLEKEKQMALALQDKSNTPGRKVERGKQSCETGWGDVLAKRFSKLEIEKARLSGSGIITNLGSTDEGRIKELNSKENSCLDPMPENLVTGKEDSLVLQRGKSQESRQMDSTWSGLPLQDVMPSAKTTSVQINRVKPLSGNIPRRKSLREKQMEDEWGGLSLGNALKPHVSKLEKEQAAWRRAEEEARQRPNFQR